MSQYVLMHKRTGELYQIAGAVQVFASEALVRDWLLTGISDINRPHWAIHHASVEVGRAVKEGEK